MKKMIVDIITLLLSRRSLWRLGRSLYTRARLDIKNDMTTNGEVMIQRCILKHLASTKQSGIIFDIGANVGIWTISALNQASELGVGGQIHIHSFEPVPNTFKTLQSRIRGRSIPDESVTLINKALSDQEGNAEIFVVAEHAGTNSLYEDPMNSKKQTIQIELSTVDKYCTDNAIKKVVFIKCDTEGNDMNVLYGMNRLIRSEKVMVVQFEYNHRWIYSRHYLKDIFDFVDDTPYVVGKVTPYKVEVYAKWHPELEKFFEGNYLVVHKDALPWFDVNSGYFDAFDTFNCRKTGREG